MRVKKNMNSIKINIIKTVLLLLAVLFVTNCVIKEKSIKDYSKYVNPMVGTNWHGHTFPGATLPFGMVQLSPDTRVGTWDGCSGYHYSNNSILGFSHTHFSGTGGGGGGDIMFMPTVGKVQLDTGSVTNTLTGYRSKFSHDEEITEPGYYRVILKDYNIEVELTSTLRAGLHKYTFLETDEANVILDLTHYSLLDRVDPDGFLQESLTGRYPGMFPRTVGGIVSLFLETGELDISEKIINSTLEAMTVNDMERIPHVFLRQTNDLIPVFNGKELMQRETIMKLHRFDHNRSGAIRFIANDKPILAVEAAISLNVCKGVLTLTLRKDKDGKPIRSMSIDAKQVNPGQLWQRFELAEPLVLNKGDEYFIRIDFDGFGFPIWFGLDNEPEQGGAYWFETQSSSPKWIYKKDHAPAYVVDVGKLRQKQISKPYEIYSDWDQIDGQANVIMAWARLAEERGRTEFEDRTYSLVAKIMDRTSDQPYFMIGEGQAVGANLVQNIALEHSREGRYWHVWDI